jgi:hypothetical protein
MAAFMVGYGIAILRTHALPNWLGWFAIALAILAAIPKVGFFALLGVIVWSLIVGVLLFVREGRPAAAVAQTG